MTEKFIKDGATSFENYLKAIGESATPETLTPELLAGMIDHTLLKPEASESQIDELCDEAAEYNFKSVCVNPYHVKRAAEQLKNFKSLVCTVIGFPLGATSIKTKAYETADAISNGADEIDMVLNVGAIKSGDSKTAEEDMKAIVKAADGNLVKIILEVCLLTPGEIELASKIAVNAGIDYVKTSTGFSTGGATVEALEIMRQTVGDSLGVKASGGIRDKETTIKMIKAGATRIGASAGIAIIKGTAAASGDKY